MSDIEKNIIISPNVGVANTAPEIDFISADASSNAKTISLKVYPTSNGTLSFEGNTGQLFSITDSMSGTIFSVNDISGIPSIEVLDTGLVKLAQYSGNVAIGVANTTSKFHIEGSGFPLAKIVRSTSLTNEVKSTFSATHKTSADMVNGFGADFSFIIQDSSGIENEIANFGAYRDGADNTGALGFWTRVSGVKNQRLTILSGGNVGVGTTTPGSKLTIVSTTSNDGISVNDGTINTIVYNSSTGTGSIGTTTNHPLAFYSNNVQRMVIDAGGYLGIGTSSPSTYNSMSAAYQNTGGMTSFCAVSGSSSSSSIEIRDGAATPNRWWLLSGLGTTTDGTFSIYDKRQTLSRLSIDTSGTVTIPNKIISSATWNTGYGEGNIYLNSTTGNRIDWNTNGVAAPSTTTRSAGTKLVLYPGISTSATDYAIGIDGGTLWNSVSASSNQFKWYANTTAVMTLSGTGVLTANGSGLTYINASQLLTGTVPGDRGVTAGSATASFVGYNGTTATAGQFDGGTTTPSGTTRLNYGGYLHATRVYGMDGIGYTTSSGGTVTQATNKSTGVTLNKVCGQITSNNASLAADTSVSFTLTNTTIAATDLIILNHVSGGTYGAYLLNARAAAGSASINIRNVTAGALAEVIVIGFAVIKAVTA